MTTTREALLLAQEIILHLLENHPTAKHHSKTGKALDAIHEVLERNQDPVDDDQGYAAAHGHSRQAIGRMNRDPYCPAVIFEYTEKSK